MGKPLKSFSGLSVAPDLQLIAWKCPTVGWTSLTSFQPEMRLYWVLARCLTPAALCLAVSAVSAVTYGEISWLWIFFCFIGHLVKSSSFLEVSLITIWLAKNTERRCQAGGGNVPIQPTQRNHREGAKTAFIQAILISCRTLTDRVARACVAERFRRETPPRSEQISIGWVSHCHFNEADVQQSFSARRKS
jgi:hypothetical protein